MIRESRVLDSSQISLLLALLWYKGVSPHTHTHSRQPTILYLYTKIPFPPQMFLLGICLLDIGVGEVVMDDIVSGQETLAKYFEVSYLLIFH